VAQPANGPKPAPVEWQAMQLLLIPVCRVDRLAVSPAVEKSPAATWQVEQAVSVVGMWPFGLMSPLKKFVPLWHCEQSPVAGWAASATL